MGKRTSLPFLTTWRSNRILSRSTCTLETLPNLIFSFFVTICDKYNTMTRKLTKGWLKIACILFMVLISNIIGAQTTIKGYEETTRKDTFSVTLTGTVYITKDSIAAYLYEPIMQEMVIYDLEPYGEGWRGKQIGRTTWIYVTEQKDHFTFDWKKTKTKLYKQ